MLLGVDDSLGRILAMLEKSGALDNTVVVFTSDHGYFYGEHGLNEERRLAYEETIRIPLLVRFPSQVKAGTVAAEMVLSLDLAPTLMELAGVRPLAGMQGRSLLPVFAGAPGDWRRSFLIEYYSDTVFPRVHRMGYSAVRTDRYKFIRYGELKGMDELYDLEGDPYEERNLMRDPGAAQVRDAMQTALQQLLEQTGATP
jgi:arylsulfatase A-like enzyme